MDGTNFEYFVSTKGPFIVVSLLGRMNSKAVPMLNELMAELGLNGTATVLVFNLRDVSEIGGDALQVFAQIQKNARARPAELRLAGVKPELKTRLLTEGIIRTSELFDNLQAAIMAQAKPVAKKA